MESRAQLQKRWKKTIRSMKNDTLNEIFPKTQVLSLADNVLTIRFDTVRDQNNFFSATSELLSRVREEFGEKVSLTALTKRRGEETAEEENAIQGLTHYETNTMTFMEGAFTSIQNKIIQRIIYESELEMREKIGEEPRQLELFNEESESKMRIIRIKLSEISRTNNYDHIAESIERLRSMPIRIPIKTDQYSGEYVTSIIHSYFMPNKDSWRKEIILKIDSDILKIMQIPLIAESPESAKTNPESTLVLGYTNPFAKGYNRLGNYDRVLNSTNNRFTQRIYKFLTAFRDKESFALTIESLRKILGIEKNYLRWADFKKTVLTEPYEEMQRHKKEWEFRFEFEEIREKSKKTGMPDGIRFYVKDNAKEEEDIEKQRKITEEEERLNDALNYLEVNITDGENALTMEQWLKIRERIKDGETYMGVTSAYSKAKSHILQGKVQNGAAYIYRTLKKELEKDPKKEKERIEEIIRKEEEK